LKKLAFRSCPFSPLFNMFAAALLFATSSAKWETRDGVHYWEMTDLSLDMEHAPIEIPEVDLRRAEKKYDPKHIVDQGQMNKALHETNCTEYIQKRTVKAKGSSKCWNCFFCGTPKGCPGSGWVKYSDFHIVGAKVGKAGVSVDSNNHVGMVVSDVSLHVKPTPFTVQEKGIFTWPCSGLLEGVISGAVSAVEAVINLSAEGIPIIGEGAAAPVDGVVMDLKHVLTGLCAILEDIIEAVLGVIEDVIQGVLGTALPDIINDLLKVIIGKALGSTGAPAIGQATNLVERMNGGAAFRFN